MRRSEPHAKASTSDAAAARAQFAALRAGDQGAWQALTDRYTNLLWSIARGMGLSHADAAEVVQMTWLRLVEGLESVRQPEFVGSWLATTARRECLTVLRRHSREQVGASADWPDLPDASGELDEAMLREERDAALWQAFGRLRPACQALLRVLMADPRPSYVEVSDALGIPIGSIGPSRQRCLAVLRQIMLSGAAQAPDAV
jgi:RNA polymerase sigma factor (sigma-70 family)